MDKFFNNCSKWIKFFAKIGFIVLAAYGTLTLFRSFSRGQWFQGFLDFNLYAFKAVAVLFVMYGFGKIVGHFEKKDASAAGSAPASAKEPAPAPAPAVAPAPAAAPAPVKEEVPVPEKKVKYCSNCGRENSADSRYCEKCGCAL